MPEVKRVRPEVNRPFLSGLSDSWAWYHRRLPGHSAPLPFTLEKGPGIEILPFGRAILGRTNQSESYYSSRTKKLNSYIFPSIRRGGQALFLLTLGKAHHDFGLVGATAVRRGVDEIVRPEALVLLGGAGVSQKRIQQRADMCLVVFRGGYSVQLIDLMRVLRRPVEFTSRSRHSDFQSDFGTQSQ